MVFQLRLEFAFVGNLTVFVPPFLDVVATNVPEFRGGKPAPVEVFFDLSVVGYRANMGTGCFQHIIGYVPFHIKNDEYPNQSVLHG
jgi:hypothetical protein